MEVSSCFDAIVEKEVEDMCVSVPPLSINYSSNPRREECEKKLPGPSLCKTRNLTNFLFPTAVY